MSAFALLGSVFKPTSLAGLFGAGPSVALATLGLAVMKEGKMYAATECRSMVVGAVALGFYSWLVCQVIMRLGLSALKATLSSTLAWFLAAFCLWGIFLRT